MDNMHVEDGEITLSMMLKKSREPENQFTGMSVHQLKEHWKEKKDPTKDAKMKRIQEIIAWKDF